jgi:hypothetical protein
VDWRMGRESKCLRMLSKSRILPATSPIPSPMERPGSPPRPLAGSSRGAPPPRIATSDARRPAAEWPFACVRRIFHRKVYRKFSRARPSKGHAECTQICRYLPRKNGARNKMVPSVSSTSC